MAMNSSNSSTSAGSASKGGAGSVSAGSQSSKGSTSTRSSNSSTGSKSTGSQASSKTSTGGATTSNSNGNFSGGRLPGLGGQSFSSWSGSGSETAAAHASGVQGPGLSSGNFGSAWSGNGNHGSGSGSYTYNGTSYSNNKSEPVMTVDEVYGKIETAYGKPETTTGTSGNQPIVEKQGDYAASSNEKSDVKTSTPGKQDDITVTPVSVTEDKGLVDNNAIESVEGLDFQQKDKESQDVMEAKKNRDEAEAEDESNKMRDLLKAKTDQTTEEDANDFQIGEEAASKEKAALDEAEVTLNKTLEEKGFKSIEEAKKHYQGIKEQYDSLAKDYLNASNMRSKAVRAVIDLNKEEPHIEADDEVHYQPHTLSDGQKVSIMTASTENADLLAYVYKRNEAVYDAIDADKKAAEADKKAQEYKANVLDPALKEASVIEDAYGKYQEAKNAYDISFTGAYGKSTEGRLAESNAETSIQTAREALKSSTLSPEQKVQAEQSLTDIEASRKDLENAASKLSNNLENANPADIEAYVTAQKQYEDNLKAALDGNPFTKTDFNKAFVGSIAKANDFDVTLADGSKMSYSQFATDMATKSPEIAKAMYNAKADKLETEGHTVLAKIERAKAAMVGTWIGSKLTQADNQVRGQFNQMAKTNMRATYAAYNNVLKDSNASPEQKAEASAAIDQANALMTASAALQASTGFLSGIGDGMGDGVYGTTDPDDLNVSQEILNAVDNFVKITLGLGVTPGANKAYQNMYYMAGAKVNSSPLFSKDFDSDGFALCQEYGNNAAAGMIAGAGELATGVALFFNPSTAGMALNLVIDSITTFTNGLYGVQKDARKAEKYTQEVLGYFKEAQSIAADTGNEEALDAISNGIEQISQTENFELKSDKVGNLDNWLEGSGSNTATNEKFNQSLTYDEWLKLIEADPTMRDYAKKLIAEKKEK